MSDLRILSDAHIPELPNRYNGKVRENYDLPVVVGTHPIPEKYYRIHEALGTWSSPLWQELIGPTLATPEIRLAYN